MQLGDEHLSKGTGFDDNHLEAETLKTKNEVNREGSLGFTSLKQVPDQSILGDKPGAHGYTDVGEFTNGDQDGGHKLAPRSLLLPHFEMVKKETEFYMDKAVTEMELRKMIVCYKEGSYHIIKDICVDEGLRSLDSILVQNAVEDEKVYDESKFNTDDFTTEHISDSLKSSTLNRQPISGVNNEDSEHASLGSMPEECGDTSHTTSEIVSSESHEKNFDEMLFAPQESSKCQCQGQIIDIHNENATQRSLASLLEEDRVDTDTAEEIVNVSETKELLPMQEVDRGQCHADLLSSEPSIDRPQLVNSDIDQPQSVNNDSEESQSDKIDSHQLKSVSDNSPNVPFTSGSIEQTCSVHSSSNREVDEGPLVEANSTTPGVSSEELKEGNKGMQLPSIGDSGGNIIAFDIESETPATIPTKDSKETFEIQQSGLVTSGSMLEETSTDGATASSRTSFSHGHADANFLGPASLSGRIQYSGQIPYSGSVSLRSDSSTTSTRSFAFPVLQSEWNSSPVRMAKADRRHLRRHRGWRSGLLCCRF